MPFDITSANAVFQLSIQNIYPAGVQLQNFGVDDAFVAEAADVAETQIGVDGYGAAGYLPHAVPMMIRLSAASISTIVFENWYMAQDQATGIYSCQAVITMPAISRVYTCFNGVLMRVSSMAEARKILENREFRISWLPNGPGQPAVQASPMG